MLQVSPRTFDFTFPRQLVLFSQKSVIEREMMKVDAGLDEVFLALISWRLSSANLRWNQGQNLLKPPLSLMISILIKVFSFISEKIIFLSSCSFQKSNDFDDPITASFPYSYQSSQSLNMMVGLRGSNIGYQSTKTDFYYMCFICYYFYFSGFAIALGGYQNGDSIFCIAGICKIYSFIQCFRLLLLLRGFLSVLYKKMISSRSSALFLMVFLNTSTFSACLTGNNLYSIIATVLSILSFESMPFLFAVFAELFRICWGRRSTKNHQNRCY